MLAGRLAQVDTAQLRLMLYYSAQTRWGRPLNYERIIIYAPTSLARADRTIGRRWRVWAVSALFAVAVLWLGIFALRGAFSVRSTPSSPEITHATGERLGLRIGAGNSNTQSPNDGPRLPFEPRVPRGGTAISEAPVAGEGRLAGWQRSTIRAGDTLSEIFSRLDFAPSDMAAILADKKAASTLKALTVGEPLYYRTEAGALSALAYRVDNFNTLVATREGKDFKVTFESVKPEIRRAQASGVITRSLFLDGQAAGLPERVSMDFADLFGWDVDFVRDIKRGDRFKIVFEEIFRDGEKVANGKIIAAEFVNGGRAVRAFHYTNSDGADGYFSERGEALKKAFLLAPLNFTKISSRFNLARRHPILNRIRAHKGVDYAAPMGTPIRAVANGKIDFLGSQSGYGNTIVLQHGDRYSTLYGHLLKFAAGVSRGRAVKQGQLLGYVGKSGLATGPHLHYEFRIGGVHVDPLTVKLPHSMPMEKRYFADFRHQTATLVDTLVAMDNGKASDTRTAATAAEPNTTSRRSR